MIDNQETQVLFDSTYEQVKQERKLAHKNYRRDKLKRKRRSMQPMKPMDKAKDKKKAFKRLVNYLKPYSLYLVLMLILSIGSSVLLILTPKLLAEATNELYYNFSNINIKLIYTVLAKTLGLYLAGALCILLNGVTSATLSAKVVYKMRQEVKSKLDKLPLNYYDENATGDILSRVSNDIDLISGTLQESITQILSSIVTVIGVLIVMIITNIWLTLIIVGSLPFLLLITMFIAKKSHKYFTETQRITGELNGHTEECYSGLNVIKLYEHEEIAEEEFSEINNALRESQEKAQFISGMIMPSLAMINHIFFAFMCVVGGILVGRNVIKLGVIQEFVIYKRNFTQPISQVANVMNIIQATLAASERVFEVLDSQEEIAEQSIDKPLLALSDNISFDNVNFGYVADKPIINDFSLKVKRGESIAIVGPTGAGKTTLVNLLMRFYELRGGSISIDGIDITKMSRSQLRSMFGMVLQDAWVFSGTIKDNVSYGNPDATMEEIINACKDAHIHHYITTLSDGYNTVINEDCTNISQGQKQLLTIARAILKNPSILILDEATSSVDTRTEALIAQAMGNLMNNRTSFIIAHRLSTIKNSTKIIVMKNGSIVEVGNHNELLSKKGFYYELYNSQFSKTEEYSIEE